MLVALVKKSAVSIVTGAEPVTVSVPKEDVVAFPVASTLAVPTTEVTSFVLAEIN